MKFLLFVSLFTALFTIAHCSPDIFNQTNYASLPSYANGLITKCEDTEQELLTIGYVYVTPDPPVKGRQFTLGFEASLSQDIAPGAKLDLTVKYGSVQLYKAALDFCETIMLANRACPLQNGVVTFEDSFVIPLKVPSGKYSVRADVRNSDEKRVTCVVASIVLPRRHGMFKIN